jgi:hypothetical protein
MSPEFERDVLVHILVYTVVYLILVQSLGYIVPFVLVSLFHFVLSLVRIARVK